MANLSKIFLKQLENIDKGREARNADQNKHKVQNFIGPVPSPDFKKKTKTNKDTSKTNKDIEPKQNNSTIQTTQKEEQKEETNPVINFFSKLITPQQSTTQVLEEEIEKNKANKQKKILEDIEKGQAARVADQKQREEEKGNSSWKAMGLTQGQLETLGHIAYYKNHPEALKKMGVDSSLIDKYGSLIGKDGLIGQAYNEDTGTYGTLGGDFKDQTISEVMQQIEKEYGDQIYVTDTGDYNSEKEAFKIEAEIEKEVYTTGVDVTGDGIADYNIAGTLQEFGDKDNLGAKNNSSNIGKVADDFVKKMIDEIKGNNLTEYLISGDKDAIEDYNDLTVSDKNNFQKAILDQGRDLALQAIENEMSKGSTQSEAISTVANVLGEKGEDGLLGGIFDNKDIKKSVGLNGVETWLAGSDTNGVDASGNEIANTTSDDFGNQMVGQIVTTDFVNNKLKDEDLPTPESSIAQEEQNGEDYTYNKAMKTISPYYSDATRGQVEMKQFDVGEGQTPQTLSTVNAGDNPYVAWGQTGNDFNKDDSYKKKYSTTDLYGNNNESDTYLPSSTSTDETKKEQTKSKALGNAMTAVKALNQKLGRYGDRNNAQSPGVASGYQFQYNE